MSLASFNAADQTMTWTGVGNVEGVLQRSDASMATPPSNGSFPDAAWWATNCRCCVPRL